MSKYRCLVVSVVLLAVFCGAAHATTVTVIGTANYNSSDYNLIWDQAQSLVWLDYSAPTAYWSDQMAWADSLNSAGLTYNIDPGFTANWSGATWRLPSAGTDLAWGIAPSETTTQELARLYYAMGFEGGTLGGVQGYPDVTAPDFNSPSCPFENLELDTYWTSTRDDLDYGFFKISAAWMFAFEETITTGYTGTYYGFQDIDAAGSGWFSPQHYGLAVSDGWVITQEASAEAIPEPLTMLSLGMGLIGVGGYVRKRRTAK